MKQSAALHGLVHDVTTNGLQATHTPAMPDVAQVVICRWMTDILGISTTNAMEPAEISDIEIYKVAII